MRNSTILSVMPCSVSLYVQLPAFQNERLAWQSDSFWGSQLCNCEKGKRLLRKIWKRFNIWVGPEAFGQWHSCYLPATHHHGPLNKISQICCSFWLTHISGDVYVCSFFSYFPAVQSVCLWAYSQVRNNDTVVVDSVRVRRCSGNNLNHRHVLEILTFRVNKILETTVLFSAEHLPSQWLKNNRTNYSLYI